MKYIMVICAFFAALPVLAQTTEEITTSHSTEVQACPPVPIIKGTDKKIEERSFKAKAKLISLSLEVREAKRELRRLQLETKMLKKRKVLYRKPPYPWPSKKCETIRYRPHQVDRCLWSHENSETEHVCESWWLVEAGSWRQDSKIKCYSPKPKIKPCRGKKCLPLKGGWKGLYR